MPSRRRAAVEDIEDAPASAQATQDSVRDDSDDEPGPSRKKAKAPAPAPAADDDADSEIDVAAFGNQPLARAHAQNVRALGADWAQLAQLARTAAGDALPEIGAALAEAGEPAQAAIKELEGMMRELVDLDGAMRAHQAVLDDMYQRVLRDEDVKDIKERWKAESKTQRDAYKAKTARQKYAKNDAYKTFRERIYEVEHDEAMPSLKDLIPREAGDDDSSDEDIEIGGATQDFKCPLTLQRLEHPMVSRVCKHAYSRAAILEFLGPGGGAKKCPASGCGHMVGRADLAEDQALARRVRDAARREEDRRERGRREKGGDETLDVDIDDEDD